jgi:hypothetical protein
MGLKRAPRVVSRRIDEEAVLMPVRTSVTQPVMVHALNPVAAFIWERLDGTRDERGLVDAVVAEFAVSPEVATEDVKAFVGELERAGLVERA